LPDLRLTIVPSVPVWIDGDAHVFDRKFHDGLMSYVRSWPGRVTCVARSASGPLPAFGAVRAKRRELPFDLDVLDEGEAIAERHMASASVVLAAADDHAQLHLGALCRRIGVRCVYVIEYVPETRYQINAIESPNALVRLRRNLFAWRGERARRAAFRACDGIQSNGLPAHEEYRHHADSHLYFDTRTGRDALVGDAELEARLAGLADRQPLRLAFSGRLVAMKGADHLVRVAARLRERGVASKWTVYGTGDLEPAMRAEVAALGLGETFEMPGAVDFDERLIPEIKAGTDLYVMLHRQSDPSCTYLETLSCGIPIVGYANRAFAGILGMADVGIAVTMDDVDGVVEAIAHLDANRELLAVKSRAAAKFSRAHAFEDTFRRRVDHLLRVAGGVQ
jgi:colanic acid/amylovoran biosynthesis glycosyltransferase